MLGAVAGWLGAVLVLPSAAALVLAFLAYRGETDHGASAFAMGGLVVSAILVGGAHAVVRLEGARGRGMRLLGAAALAAGAAFCATYPLGAIRDPGSFPRVGALIFAVLAVLQLLAAWSLVRGR